MSLPNLSPQDSSATVSIYRSKQFLLQADIILYCELSHKTVFTWSIYQVNPEDILVLSTNGTYELRITPRMLAVGTYYVQLIVSMVGTQVFGIGQGYFKVISSPLVALITGGTKVARGFDRSLVFNASLSYDPDEENQQSSSKLYSHFFCFCLFLFILFCFGLFNIFLLGLYCHYTTSVLITIVSLVGWFIDWLID